MTAAGFAIVVHGGAGQVPAEDADACLAGCRAALAAGAAILARGGGALEAVQAAVMLLEDDPRFNAGRGAVLNRDGHIELDASIMDGATLAGGAVAAVRRIRNPVALARAVLDDGRHVLLAGAGAEAFARAAGIPACTEGELRVARQAQRWRDARGTVGAVARDAAGRLAAATSTGGVSGKLAGRVGDSAVIGAGTYADERVAVSCTGQGEAILRLMLARRVAEWLADGGAPEQAARRAVALLGARLEAEGGLIVVDRDGAFGIAHNSPQLPAAWQTAGSEPHADIRWA
jgi:beta-aspartyl-peptidase (threonine type)